MRDSATGRSRGFGFLTFRDPKTVNTVMVKEHYLDGKIVSSNLEDFCPRNKKEQERFPLLFLFPFFFVKNQRKTSQHTMP
jgi:RNA recognition motif-containing protein